MQEENLRSEQFPLGIGRCIPPKLISNFPCFFQLQQKKKKKKSLHMKTGKGTRLPTSEDNPLDFLQYASLKSRVTQQ